MTLSCFITENIEAIIAEWVSFAMTLEPAASTMSSRSLRDHARPILLAIAKDLATEQTVLEQSEKSKGLAPMQSTSETAAATHGALRHVSGFDVNQLGAEYRALRASVIRLWTKQNPSAMDTAIVEDMIRFNEAVDQAVAESTSHFAAELALSRDTFLAILAHDLRSPLSAIRMLSQLLADGATTKRARLQAGQIQRSAAEMRDLIRELLEYTRTNLGKAIPVTPAVCSVAAICREAVDEVRSAHPEREFLVEVPEELVGFVDKARLRQALSNLLNNAVQHGQAESPVSLNARREVADITIQVINQGEPIPPESLQVIFDPLVQLSSRSAVKQEEPSNLGLGLFIANEVALGHHGNIEVTSDRENGTVFTMRLPADAATVP